MPFWLFSVVLVAHTYDTHTSLLGITVCVFIDWSLKKRIFKICDTGKWFHSIVWDVVKDISGILYSQICNDRTSLRFRLQAFCPYVVTISFDSFLLFYWCQLFRFFSNIVRLYVCDRHSVFCDHAEGIISAVFVLIICSVNFHHSDPDMAMEF